jgi:hypothetical protein
MQRIKGCLYDYFPSSNTNIKSALLTAFSLRKRKLQYLHISSVHSVYKTLKTSRVKSQYSLAQCDIFFRHILPVFQYGLNYRYYRL